MAREQNPYGYQSPMASIGASLGQALFGNPELAQKQAQARAEMAQREAEAAQAEAHARLLAAQTEGVDIANGASRSAPGLLAAMQPIPRPPAPDTLDGFLSDDYHPAGPAETREAAFQRGWPALLGAMIQMNGDKVDPAKIMGTAAAFGGGDELARRSMVAQGHTPGAAFALTPERADDIRTQGFDADYRKSTGVASINHQNDIPIANIRAGASRDVATINNRDDIPVANIRAGASRDVAGIAANSRETVAGMKGSNALSATIVGMYPGARLTSGDRSAAEQTRLYNAGVTTADAAHTYHNPDNGVPAVDMAPVPGKTLGQVVGEMRAAGVQVVEARDEKGGKNDGTGPHWHIAAIPPAGAGKAAAVKPPKQMSQASTNMVQRELARFANAKDPSGDPSFQAVNLDGQSKNLLASRASDIFQRTGNATLAARQAWQEYRAAVQAGGGHVQHWTPGNPIQPAAKPATAQVAPSQYSPDRPPREGARKAPDGNWYVEIGKNKDGSPRYGKVG